jgi:hypothetical protein
MAKTRRKKIAEVVADPIKKKEAPVDTRSDEQKVFDMGLRIPRTVSDEEYDNSPGEVFEEYDGANNSYSDYRIVPQWKQEDQANKTKSGEKKQVAPWTQYTATNGAIKGNEFWNESSGIYRNAMAARKGVGSIPSHDQPSLNNPTGKGYRDWDKNNTSEGSKVAEVMNKPKEEYSRPARKGDENIFPANESKPNEDMGKQQNKVAGDGSKAAEVVSKTDKPFDEAEFNQRVLDRKQKEMEENVTTIDAGTGQVTKTGSAEYVAPAPGVALNNAIQSNTAAQETQNAVLKAGIDNAETAGQVFEAPKVAEEAKKEAEKLQTQLDVNTVNTVKALEEEEPPLLGGNAVTIDAGTGQVIKTGNGQYIESALQPNNQQSTEAISTQLANQATSEPQLNQGSIPVAPVTAGVMGGINANQTRPAYSSVATKDQVEKDIAKQYQDLDSSIPEAVVDRLGVQDYYPEIGRDIAVGTFTGSRIGSQTVYSGAGGLLPQGLYDARKRALKDAAKVKNAALDKYYSGIDIASQFKPKFNETVNDAMDNLLYKKHGGNVNAFLADPESRREFSRLEAVAKNVNGYDAYASSVLEDAADDTKFIDPEQVKNALDIKRALVDDIDGVLTGKKDLAPLFAKAQVYQNIIPQVDKVLKEVLDPNRVGRLPINMRTGGVYNEPKFVEERNQFMQKLSGGTLEQDEYISGFKKFFTGNYEQIIDGLVGSTKYSAQQKDAAMNYVAGQLQKQVELENKFVATGNLGAMRLDLDRDKFEYQKQSDKESYFGTINANLNDAVNKQTGKTFNQEIADLKSKGLTGEALNKAIGNVWQQYSYGSVQKNKNGTWYSSIPATGVLAKDITAKPIYVGNKAQRTIDVAIKYKKDGKYYEEVKSLTPVQLAKYKDKKGVTVSTVDEGNKRSPMTRAQLENYGKASSSIFTKVVSHELAKGYYDSNNKFQFLNENNVDEYNKSNRKHTMARDIEQPYSRTPNTKAIGVQADYVEELLPGKIKGEWIIIDDSAGQQYKDQQSGYKVNQAAEAQGNPDTSFGSGESGGFNMSTPQ